MQSEGVSGSPRIVGAVVAGFLGVTNGSSFYVPRPSLFPLSPERTVNSSGVPAIAFPQDASAGWDEDFSLLNLLANQPVEISNLVLSIDLDQAIEAELKGSYLRDPDDE